MSNQEKLNRIQQIDARVRRLESVNDDFMARHGEQNPGIMELINNLMDERDELRRS